MGLTRRILTTLTGILGTRFDRGDKVENGWRLALWIRRRLVAQVYERHDFFGAVV
jgi:hypothetical protein